MRHAVRNYTFYIVLVVTLLSNFQSKAHFSQKPENVYDYELQMVEHSIGTSITMLFLLGRSNLGNFASDFPLLMQHKELIYLRGKQHDLSKFMHTPEFVAKYYPKGATTHLSTSVVKFYGYNLRLNAEAYPPEEVQAAKKSFGMLNIVDDRLLDELVENYVYDKAMTEEEVAQLKKELYQFEHMSDLLNRKMFENILRFRKNFGRDASIPEIFEFGKPIKLDNDNKNDWNSGEHTKKIVLEYIHSPALYKLILNIDPNLVVQTYLDATENSPFLRSKEALEMRDATISNYIESRESIAAVEQKRAKRKISKAVNFCRAFYGGQ